MRQKVRRNVGAEEDDILADHSGYVDRRPDHPYCRSPVARAETEWPLVARLLLLFGCVGEPCSPHHVAHTLGRQNAEVEIPTPAWRPNNHLCGHRRCPVATVPEEAK